MARAAAEKKRAGETFLLERFARLAAKRKDDRDLVCTCSRGACGVRGLREIHGLSGAGWFVPAPVRILFLTVSIMVQKSSRPEISGRLLFWVRGARLTGRGQRGMISIERGAAARRLAPKQVTGETR